MSGGSELGLKAQLAAQSAALYALLNCAVVQDCHLVWHEADIHSSNASNVLIFVVTKRCRSLRVERVKG